MKLVHFVCMLICHSAALAWAQRNCTFWFGSVMAMLVCVLAGWSLAEASCGFHSMNPSSGLVMGVAPPMVATVEESDDEVVEGPATPVEATLPLALRQLREMLDTLWDDGEEMTIYMMEGHLRVHLHAPELGPGQVEWHVWQELLRYGHGDQRGYLTPWWRAWLGRIIREWRAQSTKPWNLVLMQQSVSPDYRRLQLWRELYCPTSENYQDRSRRWSSTRLTGG